MIIFASPNSADQRSLYTFQSIIEDFIGQLNAAFAVPPIGKSSAKPKFGSKISTANAQLRRLKYVCTPKKKYYHEFNSATGLDYVGIPAIARRTLPRISYKGYQSRVAKEVEKFNVEAANSLAVNRYGFLTPAQVNTNTANIEMTRATNFEQAVDLLQAATSPSSQSPANNYMGSPEVPDIGKTDINNLLGLNGVMVSPTYNGRTQLQQAYNALPGTSVDTDSSNYLSSGSSFTRDETAARTALSGSEQFKYKSYNVATAGVLQSDVVNILVEKTADSYRKPEPVNLLNIQGSLAYMELSGSTADFDSMNPLEQNINFNSVAKVEYLRGFGAAGRPLWRLLDTGTFTRAMERGNPLLCRLSEPAQVLNVKNYFNVGTYDSLLSLIHI